MSRYFSFVVLLAAIVLLAILLYRVMSGFLVPMFLAAILVVIFRPTHSWILEKVQGRQQVAAGLTTAGILLAVLIPITLLVLLGVYEGRELVSQLTSGSIVDKINQARTSAGLDIPSKPLLDEVQDSLDELSDDDFDLANPFSASRFTALESSVALLGVELEMPEPNKESDEPQPWNATHDSWNQLVQALTQIRTSSQALQDDEISDEDQATHSADIKTNLDSLDRLFNRFRTSLLGGSFWARVKSMANPSEDDLHSYEASFTSFLKDQLFSIGGATTAFLGRLVLGLAIMTVALYFFLLDGPRMLETIKRLSPIDDAHEEELIQEFNRVSRAVVVATLLSAIAQGILAGFGFYFAGLESVFLLTLLTACFALVPFAGAAAVWVPVCLWLYFVDNQLWAAIGLGVYGVAIVSMADNFIKPYVLHGQSNLHPLLALLSVLGGVTALGPIGILIGPMVVAFIQTLLNILQRELSSMESTGTSTAKQNEHHNNAVSRWNSMTHV